MELNRSIEKQSLLKQRYETQARKVTQYAQEKGVENGTMETYSSSFSSSALANYLSMVVARGIGDDNMFRYSLEQVRRSFQTQPTLYPFASPSSIDSEDSPVPEQKARLNLVAFNGLSPHKREVVESIYVSRTTMQRLPTPYWWQNPPPSRGCRILGRWDELSPEKD